MKKHLLPLLFLLLPFTLLAQDAPVLYKDFYEGVKGAKSFVWDDHVNIMQINTDNENFDVIAVNDQMEILWRTSFEGFAFTTTRFKNKIVAIASTEHSNVKGSNNTYKAYLIDPATGKLLVEKLVYNGTDDYMEYPSVFTGDGVYLKFCIRITGLERKLHIGLPGIFSLFSINKYSKEFNETRELDVISLNEKLEAATTVKLPVSNGTMVTWCANKQADLFIAWLNGPSIEVYKYPDGSKSPVKQMNADITFTINEHTIPQQHLQLLASPSNNNILYYGLTYRNPDNDAELGIGKFDFATGKKLFVSEAFNKPHVKELQKSFVPVNKKLDDADLGSRDDLHLRYLAETAGVLVATVTSQSQRAGSYGVWQVENSVLINGYDASLNTKFQQILPVSYVVPNRLLPIGYHAAKNKFYVVGNTKHGLNVLNGVYGCLDVTTGQWDKMEELSKKKISNPDWSYGEAILWFADSYVVPYFSPKGLMQSKFDITLQQNNY
jgi:hypothetical protein